MFLLRFKFFSNMVSLLDKSWMMKGKATREYFQGCKDFVEFAWANKPAEYGTKIYCPCVRCNNQLFKRKDEVLDHIRRVGILRNYSCWTKHGESEVVNLIANDGDDMHGKIETGHAPIPLTGTDVLEEFRGHDQVTFGKAEHDKFGRKRKRDDNELPYNWKKISIFLTDLPYWKDNLLPNNLDVMHIEKNNGESWFGTLFNIEGKTKDGLKARQDMEISIRGSLHAIPREGNKFYIPPACYTLSLQEKKKICQFLHDVKVPDSYSSNISRRVQVKQCKILGLKSHDWHVLVQQLLPVAARGILRKEVMAVLVEFSNFYKKLCSKTLVVRELEQLQSQIALTLCKMEMIFPPSFF